MYRRCCLLYYYQLCIPAMMLPGPRNEGDSKHGHNSNVLAVEAVVGGLESNVVDCQATSCDYYII